MGNICLKYREEENGLESQFEISSFPTLLLFKDGYYYKYKENRTVEAFKNFINKKHDPSEGTKIPAKKTWLEKAKNLVMQIVDNYVDLMDDYGMSGVSRTVKVGIVVTFLLLPLILLPICCITLCTSKKEEGEVNEAKSKKE
eukprot:TRINITY_DN5033_c0_g2_i4.p1 TRINITY_DN5033_c0_g2~~TRINITY_DN5033_c0_g2_i4.p1  ORF type:complete len:142 (-),score=36.94 TRINITY_DN5033_c0_g2_i4:105-530(-)